MTKYISTNPATGEELARFSEHSDRELEQKLERAEAARVELAALRVEGPAKLIHKLGSHYQKRQPELGEIIAEEMGKPIAEAIWEADHCGDIYEHYAVEGPGFIADEHMEQPY